MNRAFGVSIVCVLFVLGSLEARGDDFGKLLEGTARRALRDEFKPREQPPAQQQIAQASRRHATFPVKTIDGWTLVAHRYPPSGPAKPGQAPVILCHGLTYNAQFWDLDPACSFAEYLATKGYDVWVVDLRGCGQSRKWVWKVDEAPEAIVGGALRKLSRGKLAPSGYETLDPRFANWDMDDHITRDVPALITLVRQNTGAEEVTWVGHSMGGIVALAYLSRYKNVGIGRLVTVGSQVTMPEGQLVVRFLEEMATRRESQLAGQLQGRQLEQLTKTSVHDMFFNVDNTNPQVYEALSGWATDVPAIGLLKQYMALARRGELYDSKNQFNYARAVGNIKIPVFLSCGANDEFAPPVVQHYLYDHVGSTDKSLVVFGRQQKYSVDAGHDDSLVGLKSQEEVYPVIEAWIAKHPTQK